MGAKMLFQQVKELKRLYGTRTDDELAHLFGCGADRIETQARQLRLSKDKAFTRRVRGPGSTRMPRWSAKDLEVLLARYAWVSNLELARRLGRSVKSVLSKANRLGLRKARARLREMGRTNVASRHRQPRTG